MLLIFTAFLATATAWSLAEAPTYDLQVTPSTTLFRKVGTNDGVFVPAPPKINGKRHTVGFVGKLVYELNHGRINSDDTGLPAWQEWELYYPVSTNGVPFFAGAWIADGTEWPKTTPPDPRIQVGSELYVVSKITASVLDVEEDEDEEDISDHTYVKFLFKLPILDGDEAQDAGMNLLASLPAGVLRSQPSITEAISTVQGKLLSYADNEMNGNFQLFEHIWGDSVVLCVIGFTCYTSKPVVHGYQQNIESIVILGQFALRIGQNGAHWNMILGYETHVNGQASYFTNWMNKMHIAGYLNRYGEIEQWAQAVDTLGVYLRGSSYVQPNVTDTCHLVMDSCTGSDQQYDTFDDCVTYVNSTEPFNPVVTGLVDTTGKYQSCIAWHASLAQFAKVHCNHAGWKKISVQLNPCQNW